MIDLKKEIKNSWVFAVVLMVFAVLLFLNKENFILDSICVFGYLAIFFGVLQIFQYLQLKEEVKYSSKTLYRGIVLILFGIVAIFKASLLASVLTILLGGYIILQHAYRTDLALFMQKSGCKQWVWVLSLAILSLVLSLCLIFDFFPQIPHNTFMGIILMLCEGFYLIENIIVYFSSKKGTEKNEIEP